MLYERPSIALRSLDYLLHLVIRLKINYKSIKNLELDNLEIQHLKFNDKLTVRELQSPHGVKKIRFLCSIGRDLHFKIHDINYDKVVVLPIQGNQILYSLFKSPVLDSQK